MNKRGPRRSASAPKREDSANITASIGVATTGERAESVEDLVHRADEAMYDAKRRGKGCCVLAAS